MLRGLAFGEQGEDEAPVLHHVDRGAADEHDARRLAVHQAGIGAVDLEEPRGDVGRGESGGRGQQQHRAEQLGAQRKPRKEAADHSRSGTGTCRGMHRAYCRADA